MLSGGQRMAATKRLLLLWNASRLVLRWTVPPTKSELVHRQLRQFPTYGSESCINRAITERACAILTAERASGYVPFEFHPKFPSEC